MWEELYFQKGSALLFQFRVAILLRLWHLYITTVTVLTVSVLKWRTRLTKFTILVFSAHVQMLKSWYSDDNSCLYIKNDTHLLLPVCLGQYRRNWDWREGDQTWCFFTHRTGRESCCSSTTGNNLCSDDAGLRGMLSKCCRSEAYCTLCICSGWAVQTVQHVAARTHTFRYSFIYLSAFFVLYIKSKLKNNYSISLSFSPSTPAYTHAHKLDEKT